MPSRILSLSIPNERLLKSPLLAMRETPDNTATRRYMTYIPPLSVSMLAMIPRLYNAMMNAIETTYVANIAKKLPTIPLHASLTAVMQSHIWKMLNIASNILHAFVRIILRTVGRYHINAPKTIHASVLNNAQIRAGITPSVFARVVEFISDPAPAQDAAMDMA